MNSLPIIDVSPLVENANDTSAVAVEIREACTNIGFFYITGHGIDESLQNQLELLSQKFFELPESVKNSIRMEYGGKAWRGYFSVGEELTSNIPDQKEGLYFGKELLPNHPLVKAQTPLHGSNLFPNELKNFKSVVLEYIDKMEKLGHALMKGLSASLGLAPDYFHQHYTNDPLILFRIFHYPPVDYSKTNKKYWGVGEHTDYGVLTILKQDLVGGLQVKSNNKWIDAPPIKNTFVCNIGDMLERMTKGLYQSTAHRVKNESGKSRMSFPLFFDPNYFAEVLPLPIENTAIKNNNQKRWDNANVHEFKGTYGEYLLQKVGKVFPELKNKV